MYSTDKELEFLASTLKAASNDVRLQILLHLVSGEKCVCKIFAHLDLPQNLVSHHLGILRRNNLITARKDSKWVHYSINPEALCNVKLFFENLLSASQQNNSNRC